MAEDTDRVQLKKSIAIMDFRGFDFELIREAAKFRSFLRPMPDSRR
jgi:hypothetical protein